MFKSSIIYHMIRLIEDEKGRKGLWFSAENIKKDGSTRIWNARLDVTKHLRGGSLAYDPGSRNMITVFDRKASMYRMLSCNTLRRLQVAGILLIEDGNPTQEYLKRESIAESMAELS